MLRSEPDDVNDPRVSLKHRILFETRNLMVINKPPDVRMDGPAPVTVEKLLLRLLSDRKAVRTTPSSEAEAVAPTSDSVTSSVPIWKAVHQLDYSTSGCLCVAFSDGDDAANAKRAARAATECFADRKAMKVYSALVHGHFLHH